MQATVMTFDQVTGAGSVVTDDGTTLSFAPAAFAAGGLRLLRPGQRVRLARSAAGSIESVTVITLALPPDARGDRT